MASEPQGDYAGTTSMFKHLNTLDVHTIEHRRQREVIIVRCLPLADHIARRFDSRALETDDLVQVARTGLAQAVDRYDVEFGSPFIAFAVPTMMGYYCDSLSTRPKARSLDSSGYRKCTYRAC